MAFRLVVLLLFHIAVWAEERDLTSLSLEDFMNVEVTSARRSSQRLSRTAAAMHVITQEDIRRSGATTLPDALRLAPGVHVAQVNGSTWAVSIRGFSSFYANKLLVMIDGRTIYSPVMSGVDWSRQLVVMEDIDRIEVIRGPAGSVWGANAVSGVIHIITKPASRTGGTLVSAAGGTRERSRVTVRHGQVTENAAWRVWVTRSSLAQARPFDGYERLEPWRAARGGFRADLTINDRNQLTLQAEGLGVSGQQYVSAFTAPGQIGYQSKSLGGPGGFGRLEWTRQGERWGQTKFQTYFNIDRSDLGPVVTNVRTWDFDLQHTLPWRKNHTLIAGGGYRANLIRSGFSGLLWFDPPRAQYSVANGFLQDDWELISEKLLLSYGAKLERYTIAGATVQPSARLAYSPTPKQTYWAAASGAVRAPSHTDFSIRMPIGQVGANILPVRLLLQGDPGFRPERLRALDAGARWHLMRRVVADISLFRYRYRHLQGFEYLTPVDFTRPIPAGVVLPDLPVRIANSHMASSTGGETTVHVDVTRSWRMYGAYSFHRWRSKDSPEYPAGSTFETFYFNPSHLVTVRSSWDFGKGWSAEAGLQRYSALAFEGTRLDPFLRADLRVARKIGEYTEISIDGKNLLRPRQAEYLGAWLFPAGEVVRSISIGVRWER